jgi:hypothetical protein
MNKNIIILLLIIVITFGVYVLFTAEDVSAPVATETATSTVNETVNETQTGAPTPTPTPIPVETVTVISDYVGMTVAEARSFATANNTMFRVVTLDGEPQMVTEDYRIGRINAVVVADVVISYKIEGSSVADESPAEKVDGHNNPYFTENEMPGEMPTEQNPPEDTDPNNHDEIIGMTTTAAKGYANTNDIDFRIGSVDGEATMVTSDFRPGRITAAIEKDVVVEYSVE